MHFTHDSQDRVDGLCAEPSSPQGSLILSYSQVETFQQCPRRWWLVQRADTPQAPKETLILGNAVHRSIEADLKGRVDGAPPTTWEQLMTVFDEVFASTLAEDDPTNIISESQRVVLRAHGTAVLETYVKRVAPQVTPVEVERKFAFPHPNDPSVTFIGRMDAVTERPAWGRTIVDWKVPLRAWKPGDEHRRVQAAAYLWADQQHLLAEGNDSRTASSRVTFVTFPPSVQSVTSSVDAVDVPTRYLDVRVTSRTQSQLHHYAGLVLSVASRIRTGELLGKEAFPARTSGLCPWCEVRGACPTGQRYVRMRGLTPQVPELPLEDGSAGG